MDDRVNKTVQAAQGISLSVGGVRFAGVQTPWEAYLFAAGAVGVATLGCLALFPVFAPANLVMLYLVAVLFVASRGRRGPAALAAAASVLAFDFCFVPPRFTFSVADVEYIWTFAVMFVVAMLISHLTIRLRREAEAARQGQKRTAMMHAFSQQLSSARGLEKALPAAVRHLADVFGAAVAVFLPDEGRRLWAKAWSDERAAPGEKERGVAQWVYDQWHEAGLGTQALPGEGALYLPLHGKEGTVGVLRVQPRAREDLMAPEQKMLLDSFAHQIGLALEVGRLEETARRADLAAETERLRSALLSAVSHDFRTPLAAILGSADALLEKEGARADGASRELLENIQTEAERLSRLVHNLLEATRLESGAVRLQKELYPLEEVLGSALDRLKKTLAGRAVDVRFPDDLPPVSMDGTLVEQVFINLLENAARHTPPESGIEVTARKDGGAVVVAVADHGAGLTPEELERVFDKFYRAKSSPGAGLGLAICRAVVNAHGGKIWADNRPGGGAVFSFTLPLDEGAGHER